MIGLLHGTILEKQPPQLLLNVAGVGYEIDAPMSTFYHLPDIGKEVTLHTHLIVREDAHLLYGFYSREERSLFRTLLKVNGVGPRLALTILSSMDTNEFIRCVINNDAESLVRLPGVGKKTAERLIIEMRDKVSQGQQLTTLPHTNINQTNHPRNQIIQDAVSALIALGYKPQEASRMVSRADDGVISSEEIIRGALRERVV
ncbi:MAG: Holliday junction branch migration protein RuvA [Pseudomonadota bacterium]